MDLSSIKGGRNKTLKRKPENQTGKVKFSGVVVVQAHIAKHSESSPSIELSDNNPSPHSQTQGTQPWAEFTQLLR